MSRLEPRAALKREGDELLAAGNGTRSGNTQRDYTQHERARPRREHTRVHSGSTAFRNGL